MTDASLPAGGREQSQARADYMHDLEAERDALAAENARLREAVAASKAGPSDSDIISVDGRMIRVESCTERHGLFINQWLAKPSPSQTPEIERLIDEAFPSSRDPEEPDNWLFIPGDIRSVVAQAIANTECDVYPEDDDEIAHLVGDDR